MKMLTLSNFGVIQKQRNFWEFTFLFHFFFVNILIYVLIIFSRRRARLLTWRWNMLKFRIRLGTQWTKRTTSALIRKTWTWLRRRAARCFALVSRVWNKFRDMKYIWIQSRGYFHFFLKTCDWCFCLLFGTLGLGATLRWQENSIFCSVCNFSIYGWRQHFILSVIHLSVN